MRSKWVLRRLTPVITALVAITAALILMLKWGILCTNLHTLQHITGICTDHLIGEAIGNLCEPLCKEKSMESFSCHPTGRRDGVVFSASWTGRRILFKTPRRVSLMEFELLHWTDDDNVRRYPSHDEFVSMVMRLVSSRINVSLTYVEAKELSHLPGEYNRDETPTPQRLLAMDNVWLLLQENEYLYSVIFAKHDIFPKLVGTCGFLYAVEHVNLVKSTSALFSLEENDAEWERRLRLALSLLEYVNRIDGLQLQLCDVQLKRFGYNGTHVTYLTPESVRKRGSLASFTPCKVNQDCYRLDCGQKCNAEIGKCDQVIESDNLQMVCEKIFLGWAAAGRIILPGLLVSAKASTGLATLLRQCADPLSSSSQSLRLALYHNLARKN